MSGGDLLAVYGIFPYDYISEKYVPSGLTTYQIMALKGYVPYMYGARNVG